jgi:hypoxanthine phosphoribosyltransferase
VCDEIERILIDSSAIQERVAELAREISKDYEGHDLLLVGVLRGCVIFLADLIRAITVPATYDFMAMSSYGNCTESSGVVRILKDLDENVEGKDVLIVEDIVDTGLTLRHLLDDLESRGAASVRVCALVSKPSRRHVEVPIHYLGFTIPDLFVVGYGLDFAQKYRNLSYIGVLRVDG